MAVKDRYYVGLDEYENALKISREDFFYMTYTGRGDMPKMLDIAGRFLLKAETMTTDQAQRTLDAHYKRKSDRVEHEVSNRRELLSLTQFERRYRLLPHHTSRLSVEGDLPQPILKHGRVYFPIANVEKWEKSKRVKARRRRGVRAWFAWFKSKVAR